MKVLFFRTVIFVLLVLAVLELFVLSDWNRQPVKAASQDGRLRVAFCVTGQLSSLELESKVRQFVATAQKAFVEVFLVLSAVSLGGPEESWLKRELSNGAFTSHVLLTDRPFSADWPFEGDELCLGQVAAEEKRLGKPFHVVAKLQEDLVIGQELGITSAQLGHFTLLGCAASQLHASAWVADRKLADVLSSNGHRVRQPGEPLLSRLGNVSVISQDFCNFQVLASEFQAGKRCIKAGYVEEGLRKCNYAVCDPRHLLPTCLSTVTSSSSSTSNTSTASSSSSSSPASTSSSAASSASLAPANTSGAPRILCLIPLSPMFRCRDWKITREVISILEQSWGRHIDLLKFVMSNETINYMLQTKQLHPRDLLNSKNQTRFITVDVDDGPFMDDCMNVTVQRSFRFVPHLWPKLVQALKHVQAHYSQEADFFVKADPDNFLGVQNLRAYLSQFSPEEEVYLGRPVTSGWEEHNVVFNHGMAYILSRATLRKLVRRFELWGAAPPPEARDHLFDMRCEDRVGRNEDINVGVCLRDVNIFPLNTLSPDERHPRFFLTSNSSWASSPFDPPNLTNSMDPAFVIAIHHAPCWKAYEPLCFRQWMKHTEREFTDYFEQNGTAPLRGALSRVPPLTHNARWEQLHNYEVFPLDNVSAVEEPFAYHKPFQHLTQTEFMQRRLPLALTKGYMREKDSWTRFGWLMPSKNFEIVFVPNGTNPFVLIISESLMTFPLHMGKEHTLTPKLEIGNYQYAALGNETAMDFYLPCGIRESAAMQILRWKAGEQDMSLVKGPQLSTRHNCTALALGVGQLSPDAVCTFGGRGSAQIPINTCACYQPSVRQWVSLPSLPLPVEGAPVVHIPAGVCGTKSPKGERLLLLHPQGLFELSLWREKERLVLNDKNKKSSWNKLSPLQHRGTPIVGGGGRFLFLFGGESQPGEASEVWAYDACADRWLPKSVGRLVWARSGSHSTRGLTLHMQQAFSATGWRGVDGLDFVVTCGGAEECEAAFLGDILARALAQST